MGLRLIQTLHRRLSISTDHTRIDYEESEDESLSSSPLSSSVNENHRLSSSAGIYSSSSREPNHRLRQSTPSLFHSPKTQFTNSSTNLSSSPPPPPQTSSS